MIYAVFASIFIGYSLLVLLVMSVERYLGASFPIFHGTSVTRRRFLTLLSILLICQTILGVLAVNDLVISQSVYATIFVVVTFPLFLFTSFKLYEICRQIRRREPVSPGQRMTRNLKNISTCLLAAACIGCYPFQPVHTLFLIIAQNVNWIPRQRYLTFGQHYIL